MYMMTAEMETYLVWQWITGGLLAWVLWFIWSIVMVGCAAGWNPEIVNEWANSKDGPDRLQKAPIWLTAARLVIWPWGVIDRGMSIVRECRIIQEKRNNRFQKN